MGTSRVLYRSVSVLWFWNGLPKIILDSRGLVQKFRDHPTPMEVFLNQLNLFHLPSFITQHILGGYLFIQAAVLKCRKLYFFNQYSNSNVYLRYKSVKLKVSHMIILFDNPEDSRSGGDIVGTKQASFRFTKT